MKRLVLAILLLAACRMNEDRVYLSDIAKWHSDRAAGLKRDNGWLSLVGLFWLNPGANDVKLPSNPPSVAHVTLQDGKVTLDPNPAFTIDGKPVAAPVVLVDDTDPKGPTVVKSGTLSYAAIKRSDVHGDRFALRARDPRSEARTHFKGLDYFPTNSDYRVEARFEPYNPPKKIPITNVLGMVSNETSPGALVFSLGGKELRIDPILEQGEKDLFIIFKDATSGHETYGAARYLYAHPPDASGRTIVDFNKAYNPPCAFTPYATCPLPPPQNRLPVRVEAGEKTYTGGHH
jgi:uncharacterized protein (DUF1684 family)